MHILNHRIRPIRIDATAAELLIELEVSGPSEDITIRGRLHGPRCAGVQTSEIDYPIGQHPRPLTGRIWIAEPVFAEPERPFRYDGIIEIWRDGAKLDQRPITIMLKPRSSSP